MGVAIATLASCTTTSEDPASSASNITGDVGVDVGVLGGGVRDPQGAFSVIIPPGALDTQVNVKIRRVAIEGAGETPAFRVIVSPSRAVTQGVLVELDLEKLAGDRVTDLGDLTSFRLASGVDQAARPSAPLGIQGRLGAHFAGITYDLDRVYGLVETPSQRAGGPLPSCVAECCKQGVSALEGGACSCDLLSPEAQACLQQNCQPVDLTIGCIAAPAIDCGGETCSTCCVANRELECNAECATQPGKVIVDCLRDSDCGSGLKCCVPSTRRGGGVLTVDDNRITCKADCGGEMVHLCDLDDPDRCEQCTAAKSGCVRGFCGDGSKTPTQLFCP